MKINNVQRDDVYLKRISGENFRVFGMKDKGAHLELEFAPGLNVLVGENDTDKTSVIDASRRLFVLGGTPMRNALNLNALR